MHEDRVAEISKADLVAGFAERLPSINRLADEAESMVREIQLRSGLLIERRRDVFAFSHLTFQEYFAAVEIVHKGDLLKLLKVYRDPWWHEAIALAAGLPGADASGLVRALLRLDHRKIAPSTATLLAAQCAETAIDLPVSLRREVESKLASLVPPRSDDDIDRLVRLGEVTGPVLLRALGKADARGRMCTTVALGEICYEPATNALIRLLADEECAERLNAKDLMCCRLGQVQVGSSGIIYPVASFVAAALLNVSVSSVSARKPIEQALRRAPPAALKMLIAIHKNEELLRSGMGELVWQRLDALISSMSGKPAPKRGARSG
jgi:hypothetical protein